MVKKMNSNIWRKNYDDIYQEHLDQGTQVYGHKPSREFIVNQTDLSQHNGTLLDVGCGDGTWSVILDEWYSVTGVDNSRTGIECCNLLNKIHNTKVNFIHADIGELKEMYDIVFCRCPEFFGGYAPDTATFNDFLELTMNLASKLYYLILYSREPFDRYANKEMTSYYHNPETVREICSTYGTADLRYKNNYIVVKVVRGDN